MIPEKWTVPIPCDCCGETRNIILETDRIEEDGFEISIEESLRDWGWELSGRHTFCPQCVEKALAVALRELADQADRKGGTVNA